MCLTSVINWELLKHSSHLTPLNHLTPKLKINLTFKIRKKRILLKMMSPWYNNVYIISAYHCINVKTDAFLKLGFSCRSDLHMVSIEFLIFDFHFYFPAWSPFKGLNWKMYLLRRIYLFYRQKKNFIKFIKDKKNWLVSPLSFFVINLRFKIVQLYS